MLSRQHRFHGRNSLAYAYSHGRSLRAQDIQLKYVRNSRQDSYRLAVIVSRKVHKSAVARNRLRRRIYEIVRTGPAISEPYDVIITVFSEHASLQTPLELTRSVHKLLAKAGVYRKPTQDPSSPHDIVKTEKG